MSQREEERQKMEEQKNKECVMITLRFERLHLSIQPSMYITKDMQKEKK